MVKHSTPKDQQSILGENPNDADVNLKPSSLGVVWGDSGLRRSGGFINSDFRPNLNGTKGAKVYDEMATDDALIFGTMFVFSSLFRNAGWSILPPEDQDEDEARDDIEFVENYLKDMSTTWSDFMSSTTTMFIYGYAPIEVTYTKKDGRIVPDRVDLRGQQTIEKWWFNDLGDPVAFQQQTERGSFQVPLEKCMLMRTINSQNSPLGQSILRGSVRPWNFKKRVTEIEGVGVERDLAGLPLVRIPASLMNSTDPASQQAYKAYVDMVTEIRQDARAGVVIPSDRDESGNLLYEFELMSTGGSRQFDTTKIIERYDRDIATSMLADFLLIGHTGTGAYSLSVNKTELFTVALSAYLGVVQDEIQRRLIDDVWKYNGLDDEQKPKFQFNPIELPDLEALANYVNALSSAGAPMFPDVELENVLRDRAGIPPVPKDRDDGLFSGLEDPLDDMDPEDDVDEESEDELDTAKSNGKDSTLHS